MSGGANPGVEQDRRRRPPDPSLLRTRVYLHLKDALNRGDMGAGTFLDLSAIGRELALSRTPLRDALLRLESEGFVTIHPRRGVMVRPLDPVTVRNLYQIIGALEGSVLEEVGGRFRTADLDAMVEANRAMEAALDEDDFDSYYRHNLRFHDTYLDLCANPELLGMIRIQRERLYDFPRRNGYVRAWERASTQEHGELVRRLGLGDFGAAAAFMRDVHWSYSVQEPFIHAYYFDDPRRDAR